MSQTVISVENLSKAYRLGQIGTGTLTNDMKVWWAKKTGKPNPMLKIGQVDNGNMDGETLWALKDVSFQVEQGEVLGIIGRNGAGKSTLLKILSRVTAPTSGCVKVKGRIASLLEVGTGFHPDLTGRENIYLNGAILGMTKEEVRRKFDEIVAFAEIEKFIDTPVKRYSSGMYVRLAFAVAAHLESEILLVDEVLAVGDAEFQKKCLGKIGDVASKEGRTVLFVSHNMSSVKQLCESGLILSEGNMEFLGDIETTVSRYVNNRLISTNIIANGRSAFSNLAVQSILINGSSYNELVLFPESRNLEISILGYTSEAIFIGLEAKLVDSNGISLFYYSPSHFDSKYSKSDYKCFGAFKIIGQIKLPLLTKGNFFLDIYLSEPSVRMLWECNKALHIISESVPLVSKAAVMEYAKGFGASILDGDFKIQLNGNIK